MRRLLTRIREERPTLWQFLMFAYIGLFTTAIDFGVFALCNYLLFTPYSGVGVSWWLIDYSVEAGGLCSLLSFALSFALSQIFAFIVQRKKTFHAQGRVAISALLYAIMVLLTYFLQLYLPTVILPPVCAVLGKGLGEMAVKVINAFVSMLIQFPINKWVIMRPKQR